MKEIYRSKRPKGQASIVREWVQALPPRMQGVILTAIRGADTSPREDAIKTLARFYRGVVIHGLNDAPQTFLKFADYDLSSGLSIDEDSNTYPARDAVSAIMYAVLKDHDAYPHHYLLHLIHAAQIVGTYHPETLCRTLWDGFYVAFCHKMHMKPETQSELEKRLCEADESAFAAAQ